MRKVRLLSLTRTIDRRWINDIYFNRLNDQTETQIYFGGSSSGKSVFLAQRCVRDICMGGRNYLCIRNVKRYVKVSIFNEIIKVITFFRLTKAFRINYTDLTITCFNGYQILFVGLDDVEKVKSITPAVGIITDIWVEEATEILESDIAQLEKRLRGLSAANISKRITLSFNPILKSHWIFTKYFGGWQDDKRFLKTEKLLILKTTYKDNRFLTKQDIDRLEKETDKYYYEVYTLGNWGILGAVIFKNWEVRDLSEERKIFDGFTNGLDFGFSSDPAALVRTHYDKKKKTIYILDELYERELTNDLLAVELEKIIGQEYVTCDSAEPKSIKELRNLGIRTRAAKKGKDSINFGIDWLQRQTIVIDVSCQNFKNEIQAYKWKEDRDSNVLKVPVEKNNHLMDGLRYAYEDEMLEKRLYAVNVKGDNSKW